MSGNQIVKDLLNDIYERIYLRYRTERIPLIRMDEADKEHALLLNAIKRRDRQGALNRLNAHFLRVRKNISLIIRKESESWVPRGTWEIENIRRGG